MPLSTLIGNDRIKSILARAVSQGRIGQGLILAGPAGIGKRQFALALAQVVNCPQALQGDACGKCSSCQRILSGDHLDVATYSPDGQFIKIDQMRDMSAEAQYKPREGQRRVLIIDDADRLKIEAANAILKTLEEPPETSLVLLITTKPYALLDTIRSRCQMLSFAPLSSAELERYLSEEKRPAKQTSLLARLARGSIGRALEIDLSVYCKQREFLIGLIESAMIDRDSVQLINASEHLAKKLERDEFILAMDNVMTLLADIFHLKLDGPATSIVNVDEIDRLGRIADKLTTGEIVGLVDRVETLMRALPRNVSRQLGMESLLLSTAGLHVRAPAR